jgi:siroheme synthase-like protein
MSGRPLYPLFADLRGRRCAVVGGGAVATEKARKLADHGALLRVIAPDVSGELAAMLAGEGAERRARAYRAGDLEGCLLAVAATDRPAVNRSVAEEAEARGILADVVDDPAAGTFIVPSLVRRGDLTVAISTGGASPVVAAHLRRRVETAIGPEWEVVVGALGELRAELKERYPAPADRRAAVERLLSDEALSRMAVAGGEGARALARELLDLGVPA